MKIDIDDFKKVLSEQILNAYDEHEVINIIDLSKKLLLKELDK